MASERNWGSRSIRAHWFVALLGCLAVPARAAAQDATDPAQSDQQAHQIASSGPTDVAGGLLSEPRLLTKGINIAIDMFGNGDRRKDGFYLEMSNMITGAGFVSLGPGYRQYLFGGRAFADASAALSWHLYKMVQGRFEAPELAD